MKKDKQRLSELCKARERRYGRCSEDIQIPAFETVFTPARFISGLIAHPAESNFCKAKDKECGAPK